MRYVGDCPACGDRHDWLNGSYKSTNGVELLSDLLARNCRTEYPGNWLIEVVVLQSGRTVVHSTRFGCGHCYIWDIADVDLYPGDIKRSLEPPDLFETDEDFS